jgi:ubiquinone/menaquinone biosynthesis C-methylase UbiE
VPPKKGCRAIHFNAAPTNRLSVRAVFITNGQTMIASIKKIFIKHGTVKPAREAYDTWASSYDSQPGNLMLDLDEFIFSELLAGVEISGKTIADIGCGTGRHWKKIHGKNPAKLAGFDISPGMLAQLSLKYPNAAVHQIADNRFEDIPDASFDCIVSTLTIAHICDLNEAIAAWSRMLKKGGDVIITDFHPSLLDKGGKRSFSHDGKTITVRNYPHSINDLAAAFKKHGCIAEGLIEKYIDENVRHYYAAKKALPVYERFKGAPVIYGLYLRKKR